MKLVKFVVSVCLSQPLQAHFFTDYHDILPLHWKHLPPAALKFSMSSVKFQGDMGKRNREIGQIYGFPGIFGRSNGRNSMEFIMHMHLDHLQKGLDYGYGLLILLILVQFSHSESGQICGFQAVPGECVEGIVCNLACLCIMTTFRTE